MREQKINGSIIQTINMKEALKTLKTWHLP
jgi:hypothetical protein